MSGWAKEKKQIESNLVPRVQLQPHLGIDNVKYVFRNIFRTRLFGACLAGFLSLSLTILSIDRKFQGIRMCRWIQHGCWNVRANRRCTVARVSVVVAVHPMITVPIGRL